MTQIDTLIVFKVGKKPIIYNIKHKKYKYIKKEAGSKGGSGGEKMSLQSG